MPGTRTEKAPKKSRERVAVLLTVLSYDDLLAPEPLVVVLPRGPRVTLGRAEQGPWLSLRTEVDLDVRDAFASTRHAAIRRGETDVISDLDSRNGTYVDGVRVSDHPLTDGALIEIGHTLLCYRKVEASEVVFLGKSPFGPVVTVSPALSALSRDLARIAPSREPVLLLAESGAGKEVAARMIHTLSGRRGELVSLDGGAIPDGLFESTLFGHARGAYTGATDARRGALEAAHQGTLFLDEVANLSLAAQAKLLRAWEEGTVTPVGSSTKRAVDVRFVAATNAALEGGFRGDLRQRMSGYVARLPPLRDRREDLGLLTAHLLREAGVTAASIIPEAARRLFSRPFPGNVRELRQVLRAAALLAQGEPFEVRHLGEAVVAAPHPVVADDERTRLVAALATARGNIVRTAALLETHPRQVYRMVARHGVDLAAARSDKPV